MMQAPVSAIDRQVSDLVLSCRNRGHRALFLLLDDPDLSLTSLLLHLALQHSFISDAQRLLWCHKHLGLPNGLHAPRRLVRDLRQRAHRGEVSIANSASRLDLLQAAVELHCCTYSNAATLLGQTFDSAVLQDVRALTPNLMAQTIETVRGGGIVVIVCSEVNSLEDLASLQMDAHARYKTPSHRNVKPRFNLRFLRSLASCEDAMVLDRRGRVMRISRAVRPVMAIEEVEDGAKLEKSVKKAIKRLTSGDLAPLIRQCRTSEQAKVLQKMIAAVLNHSKSVVALTAARGRGKSAAVGLCVAAAMHSGISDIWAATPSLETASTLLHFAVVGLRLLNYKEGEEFGTRKPSQKSAGDDEERKSKEIELPSEIWLCPASQQRRRVRVLNPLVDVAKNRCDRLQSCDLLCIDEAAAIPLPVVRTMLACVPEAPVVMASTVNGYEGTGRSLSLKLLTELRSGQKQDRTLKEFKLYEAIRYRPGDRIESWLSDLLCLDCLDENETTVQKASSPEACHLLLVNRTSLFSGHQTSERFLRGLTSLFVSSHYRNSPNDLQLLADSPSQHLFVLSPLPSSPAELPEPLVAIQVAMEGCIPGVEVRRSMNGTQRPAGDLMAWTLCQQFCKEELATRRGARVVRIAVLPELQGRGYGSRALKLLHQYLEGEGNAQGKPSAEEGETVWPPSAASAPLLSRADENNGPGKTDYIGVAFGLTTELLRFWRRAGYRPVYLRHTRNEQTGEHSCLMLRGEDKWVREMESLFIRDFIRVSPQSFSNLPPTLALSLIRGKKGDEEDDESEGVERYSDHDLNQLRSYCRGQCDFHMLLKLLPSFCEDFFSRRLRPESSMTLQEEYILFCLGGQAMGRVEDVADILSACLKRRVTTGHVLGLFKRMMTRFLGAIEEQKMEVSRRKRSMEYEDQERKRVKTTNDDT